MDLRKEYRAAKWKELYQKKHPAKVKIINLMPYSSWKINSVSYKRFKCNACLEQFEATNFYISCLRYCLVVRRTDMLRCKSCHNTKRPIIKKDTRRQYKVASPIEVPLNIQEWLRNERLKKLQKQEVPATESPTSRKLLQT